MPEDIAELDLVMLTARHEALLERVAKLERALEQIAALREDLHPNCGPEIRLAREALDD